MVDSNIEQGSHNEELGKVFQVGSLVAEPYPACRVCVLAQHQFHIHIQHCIAKNNI